MSNKGPLLSLYSPSSDGPTSHTHANPRSPVKSINFSSMHHFFVFSSDWLAEIEVSSTITFVISTHWHKFSPENAGKSHNAEIANSLAFWGIRIPHAWDENRRIVIINRILGFIWIDESSSNLAKSKLTTIRINNQTALHLFKPGGRSLEIVMLCSLPGRD